MTISFCETNINNTEGPQTDLSVASLVILTK